MAAEQHMIWPRQQIWAPQWSDCRIALTETTGKGPEAHHPIVDYLKKYPAAHCDLLYH